MKFALSEPPQPPETDWNFIESLKTPLWDSLAFQNKHPQENEISIAQGVSIHGIFPDPEGSLETAYQDLQRFFNAAHIPQSGPYPITITQGKTECHEAYRLEITKAGCSIIAADTEGVRRGIFFFQDEMLRTGGPFLPIGITSRKPQIRTRLSRCFFGPINRPPKRRDELMDDIDYYPDEYLNRLAHQAVNGLWLTVNFWDICPSPLFPNRGENATKRLNKLRRTVEKCARYGIRIYLFCIEPKGFGYSVDYLNTAADLERNPEFGGHRVGDTTYFCPGSSKAQTYLEDSAFHLFSQVPGLGGMIAINLGERPTHCRSAMIWDLSVNNCPHCANRQPWETFRDTLEPLRRGMQRANRDAELISWLYVPHIPDQKDQSITDAKAMIEDIAAHFPEGITFQYNFESMGTLTQLGKKRFVKDYSLAYVGPSRIFTACAKVLKKKKSRISAKLQVGCSHEVATVPFVPAPGNLFRKYRAMHRLGVTDAMHSWYFGNYPSLMTKAAGELSFAPLPSSEKAFLQRLASSTWATDASAVAQAWSLFSKAYRHFPANLTFAWYGPVHDAIAWPLHLFPTDTPIARSWLLNDPPSGDRIGECVGFDHSLEEAIILCTKMHRTWSAGLRLLHPLLAKYKASPEHIMEIGVAKAMGLQISSALNVLKFYAEREKLLEASTFTAQLKSLDKLRKLVVLEIENSSSLEKLSEADSRLGFHSEAEGYKYFPAKLRWRTQLLQSLLEKDFVEMECLIRKGDPLPSLHQPAPHEKTYSCKQLLEPFKNDWRDIPAGALISRDVKQTSDWRTTWQAVHYGHALHFKIECAVPLSSPPIKSSQDFVNADFIRISIEPRRFWPTRDFLISSFGAEWFDSKETTLDSRWKTTVTRHTGGWTAEVVIPLECLSSNCRPLFRINIERHSPGLSALSWIARHPMNYRLIFGENNPIDFGWINLVPSSNSEMSYLSGAKDSRKPI